MNSAGTSPTYSDTPFLIQAGKYILVIPLIAISSIICYRKPLTMKQWLIAASVMFLIVFSIMKAFGGEKFDFFYIETIFWMTFALSIVWATDSISIRDIDKYFLFLLIYGFIATFIEVLLFIFIGRLPALAYEGGVYVRFGSFLDDPNGYAAILILLLGWAYGRFYGKMRIFVLAGIGISLILTESFTVFLYLVFLGVIWGLIQIYKKPIQVLTVAVIIFFAAILLIRNIPQSTLDILRDLYAAKQLSAHGHEFPLGKLITTWPDWSLYGYSKFQVYESGWGSDLVSFGVPLFSIDLALVCIFVGSIGKAYFRASDRARPLYIGFFLLGLYYLLGSLVFDFAVNFPVNAIFFLSSFLVVLGKITDEESNAITESTINHSVHSHYHV